MMMMNTRYIFAMLALVRKNQAKIQDFPRGLGTMWEQVSSTSRLLTETDLQSHWHPHDFDLLLPAERPPVVSVTTIQSITWHMRSHCDTFHQTLVNTPCLNPSQTECYSVYLPRREERLCWPWCGDNLPVRRQSPIQVDFDSDLSRSQTNDFSIIILTCYHYTAKPLLSINKIIYIYANKNKPHFKKSFNQRLPR